ncbi:hypothetical protein N665_0103s0036 [Sinapis alba]|nr:hypothetical protein N665_0103s0036 [Sinapis alba]
MNALMPFTSLGDLKPFKSALITMLDLYLNMNIQNITFSSATGMYRSTDHSYKMGFVYNTTIKRSNHVNEDMCLSLVDFNNHFKYLYLKCLSNLIWFLHMSLIPCCLWGKFAEIVYEACTQNKDEVTICLIRFAKIENLEEKSISLCESTKEKLELETINGVQDKCKKWCLSPQRRIRELSGCLEVSNFVNALFSENCLVMCTIYAIDSDWGWYYFGCNICNKKVFKTKFMLLDLVAKEVITESATELLNGSFDELEDPTDLSNAITQVVGNTFTFGVYVEKGHIIYGAEIYKVGGVYKERMKCLNNEVTQTRFSSASHLTDGQDNNEVMSTPFTKRKDNFGGAPDISSSTKKVCSKDIKVEKMNELESKSSENN